MTYFLSSALGLIVVSRRLAADPRFRQLGGYALGAGITGVALFVLMGAFVVPDDALLHAWAGLAQRIVILVVFSPVRSLPHTGYCVSPERTMRRADRLLWGSGLFLALFTRVRGRGFLRR